MAKADYEFIDDDGHGIFRIVLRNHWDLAIVERFKVAEQAWWARISRAPGSERYLLVDASAHGVQSQEIVTVLQNQIEHRQKIFDRTAVVIASTLHQMQAGRVRSNSEDHRACGSVEEALAWLCPAEAASAA